MATDTIRALHAAYNERQFNSIAELVRPHVTYVDHPRGKTMRSREEYLDWLTSGLVAFPNSEITAASYLTAGRWVTAMYIETGTHDGPIDEHPPTGRSIELPICTVFGVEESGKITAGRVYYDMLTLYRQLGLPAPATA